MGDPDNRTPYRTQGRNNKNFSIMDNKMIVQSYQFTTAKQRYNLTCQRAMLHIIKYAQYTIEGQTLNGELYDRVQTDQWENKLITIPLRELDPKGETTNYTYYKEELKQLFEITAEWKYKGGRQLRPFVQGIKLEDSGVGIFEVNKEVWQLILDYSKGYRKFELQKALECKNVYSMRFYELISGKTEPINYTMEYLKKMFKVEKTYKANADFIKHVIDIAKKELDKIAPYTFRYEKIYDTEHEGKGRKPIKGIRIYPIYQPEKEDTKLAEQEFDRKIRNSVLNPEIKRILTDYYEFSVQELNNNLDLFLTAGQYFDLDRILRDKLTLARQSRNPKGYLIGILKRKLAEYK